MKKGLVVAAVIVGLCGTQAAFSASSYFPNTNKVLQNTQNAFKADVEAQKQEAINKQKAKEAEYKKQQEAQKAAYEAKKKAQQDALKKKQAEQKAAYEAKKKAQQEALKKKTAPATQAQKDYEATKQDLQRIKSRYSK